MATRLRHIAIIVPDPEKAATFFEQAFGMTRAGTARRGIYMSDGVINRWWWSWLEQLQVLYVR